MLTTSINSFHEFNHHPWETSVLSLERNVAVEKVFDLMSLQRQAYCHTRPDTSQYQRQKKNSLISSIGELTQLQGNWDGEGAIPIANGIIPTAQNLLNSIFEMFEAAPLPEYSPNPNGTLSFYWTLPHGSAELEIGRTKYSWAVMNKQGAVTTFCSGDNKAFENGTAIDLFASLTPLKENLHEAQLTHLVMQHEWDEYAECA